METESDRIFGTSFSIPAHLDEDLQMELAEATEAGKELPPRGEITLYIRRGDSPDPKRRTRVISMSPVPPGVAQDDLAAAGFVFDGPHSVSLQVDHSTAASVSRDHAFGKEHAHGDPVLTITRYPEQQGSLFDQLQEAQNALVEWLKAQGYTVRFA